MERRTDHTFCPPLNRSRRGLLRVLRALAMTWGCPLTRGWGRGTLPRFAMPSASKSEGRFVKICDTDQKTLRC